MVKTAKSASTAGKKTTAPKAKQVNKTPSNLLKILPESVEHIEIVQQVAGVLEELQKRVLDVKEEASKELKKLMKRYETNYKGLEKRVHSVTLEAKKQAQTSMIHILQKWHEHKDKLPKPLAQELEKIIDQIGAKVVAKASAKKKVVKKPSSTNRKKTAPAENKIKATPAKKTSGRTLKTMSKKNEVPGIPHNDSKL